MNEKQAAAWRNKRKLGRKRYVMVNGMATWGLLLTILSSLLEYTSQGHLDWRWIVVRLVVFGFIGFFVASLRWNSAEYRLSEYERGHR